MTSKELVIKTIKGENPGRTPVYGWVEANLSDVISKKYGSVRNFEDHYQFDMSHIFGGPGCLNPEVAKLRDAGEEITPEVLLSYPLPDPNDMSQYQNIVEQLDFHHQRDRFCYLQSNGIFECLNDPFGIENHLYAFYDYPELMHRMNRELTDFHLKCLEKLLPVFQPEYMTFAEDMSYNHGPMLSKELFDEFMLPYYRQVVPVLRENGVKVLIDTDGNVEPLIPWFQEAGIQGVLPLERQAGVDVNRIRENYPEWLMIGGYDKTIMHLGEGAMRREFERLLPAMRSGRYVPSVDHQTPPDVSADQYRIYVRLLAEYAKKTAE